MAEEEKVDVAESAEIKEEVAEEPRKAKPAPKRKPKHRRQISRKVEKEAVVKREAKPVKPKEKKSEIAGVSVETLLAVLLVIAVIASFYFFFEKESLKGEVDSLRKLVSGQTGTTLSTSSTIAPYSGEKVVLDFYIMSQCPYGIQVVDAIAPVLKQLGGAVTFRLNYIATDNGGGAFSSLHGPNEVLGDTVELCAAKYEPSKYVDMMVCMNADSGNIPTNWQSCAEKYSMDVQKIKSCYEGSEGKQLLSDSIKKSDAVNAQGSPTIYVNGQTYSSGRTSNDFLRALCAEYNTKPDVCKNIPAPVKVNLIALSDTRCGTDCDLTSLVSQLKSLFPGLVVKQLDYSSAEGKSVYESANLTALPALLFDSTVQNGEGYQNVERYLDPAGPYLSLRIGAAWDPYCDGSQEHCNDSKCSDRVSCRAEVPGKLDVFVMSHCPYGIQALDAMKEVLNVFNGQIRFSVNYIAEETSPGVFNSLHGQTEVDDDMRELCAMKYYPDNYTYMNFIWCRDANSASTEWESCATDNGMDAAKIKACAEGSEGKQLLSDNIKIAQQLSIGGSPTFLVNNKKTFNAVNAAGIQVGICGANAGLSGCSKTVSTPSGATASTASSGGSCG